MNHVVLVGRLTRDVELKYLPGNGTPVAQFTIAVDREFTGKDGKKETDFMKVGRNALKGMGLGFI